MLTTLPQTFTSVDRVYGAAKADGRLNLTWIISAHKKITEFKQTKYTVRVTLRW